MSAARLVNRRVISLPSEVPPQSLGTDNRQNVQTHRVPPAGHAHTAGAFGMAA